MARSKYPLASLEELRKRKVDEGATALADARAERERAETTREALETAKRAVVDEAARVVEAEMAKLNANGMTAEGLRARYLFEEGARVKASLIDADIEHAKEHVAEARALEATRQTDLLARQADRRVVELDAERFRANVSAKVDAAEQEEAEEAWRPRNG